MANFGVQHLPLSKRFSKARRTVLRTCFVLSLSLFTGCATNPIVNERPFTFETDSLSYANQLNWEYKFDDAGKWSAKKREPSPDYTLHCFVVARSAKQFFQNARFVPELPREDKETNRKLIRKVIRQNPRKPLPLEKKVTIPGYANLRAFSQDNESILKQECGGAWQSYFQRGNWRMLLPFSRGNQQKEAQQLEAKIHSNQAPVVHIVQFPSLAVNHAILLFDVDSDQDQIRFAAYDPNKPEAPTTLTFDRRARSFSFPQNDYFIGGKVNVYEVYDSWPK